LSGAALLIKCIDPPAARKTRPQDDNRLSIVLSVVLYDV
jgi:hypothetical protein